MHTLKRIICGLAASALAATLVPVTAVAESSWTSQLVEGAQDPRQVCQSGERLAWTDGLGSHYTWKLGDASPEPVPTPTEENEDGLDLDGDRLVWVGYADGSTQVYTWKVGDADATHVSTTTSDRNYQARVSGDRVAWRVDSDGAVPGIFTWSASSPTPALVVGSSYVQDPAVSGDRLAWIDNSGATTQVYTQLVSEGSPTHVSVLDSDSWFWSPAVDGDRVVWAGQSNTGVWSLYTWTSAAGASAVPISAETDWEISYNFQVSDDKIVYQAKDAGGDAEIYLYDAVADSTTKLSDNDYWDSNPKISGSEVSWLGNVGSSDSEIFKWSSSDGIAVQLTDSDDYEWQYGVSPTMVGYIASEQLFAAIGGVEDSQAPSTLLEVTDASPNSAGWFKDVPTITLSTEPGAQTYYAWDPTGGDEDLEKLRSVSIHGQPILMEGEHALYYYSFTDVDNPEAVQSATFKLDYTPPSAPVLSGENTGLTTSRLSWTASSDALSGFDHYALYEGASLVTTLPADTTSYDLSDLTPDTDYTYTVRAVDVAGNAVASNAATVGTFALEQQPTGDGVSAGEVKLVFDSAWTTGTPTVAEATLPGTLPSGGMKPLSGSYYDISTSGAFSGSVKVTLTYSDAGMSSAEEASIRLYHYSGGAWSDITDAGQPNTGANTVTGTTSSFSGFGIFYTQDSEGSGGGSEEPDPPVVSTPASSTWSLVLLGALAFIATAVLRRETVG